MSNRERAVGILPPDTGGRAIDTPTLIDVSTKQWLILATEFELHFSAAVGSEHMLQQFKVHTHHQCIREMGKARARLKQA